MVSLFGAIGYSLLGLGENPARAQGAKRSKDWPRVRRVHLARYPRCEVCGAARNCVPHHVDPFHLFPERELDPSNLITLCEGPGVNCHLLFGHLNNFASYNPLCIEDVDCWHEKIGSRPSGKSALRRMESNELGNRFLDESKP